MPISDAVFLITKLHDDAVDLCNLLEQRNICAYPFPILKITPLPQQLPIYDYYDFVIFVSRYSVLNSLCLHEVPITSSHWIAAGEGTASTLGKYLFQGTIIFPEGYGGSDGVCKILNNMGANCNSKKVLLVRGDPTRASLSRWLTEEGANLEEYVCYRRSIDNDWDKRLSYFLDSHKDIIWVLTSTETARIVCSFLQSNTFCDNKFSFLCTHPRIRDNVLEWDVGPVFLAPSADVCSLLDTITMTALERHG
ncbi:MULTISPECIES: uroporphyrinogen-III synthase [Candidatus Ichthyocystis]|uniref:uroporphyrinogen-III synthase n=1 Tax=Candidatus Ichthyocystis TaxID=2929841 RepID=UPI000B8A0CE0|nr:MULTISPECIES: uroporphyrinogen-III synthase [Ichthyocystis]